METWTKLIDRMLLKWVVGVDQSEFIAAPRQFDRNNLHTSPQRHLNPRTQFCPVPTQSNPFKSGQCHRATNERRFVFKGLRPKCLNLNDPLNSESIGS